MATRTKAILLIFAVAIPAFLLAETFFPPPPGPGPTDGQLPFFIVLAALDSLLLGIGVAFIVFAWPMIRRAAPSSRSDALAIYLPLVFLMVSWYPQLGLHPSAFGADFFGILVIDYAFHLPLIVAPLVLIWGFVGILRDRPVAARTAP